MTAIALTDKAYYQYLVEYIPKATSKIFISMFLMDVRLKTDPQLAVRKLIKLVASAKKRGVETKILVGLSETKEIFTGNVTSYGLMKLFGLDCKLFHNPDLSSHAKYIIIDNKVILGSHNWEHGAFEMFNEDSIVIESEETTSELTKLFLDNWQNGQDPNLNINYLQTKGIFEDWKFKKIPNDYKKFEVSHCKLLINDKYYSELLTTLKKAQRSISVIMFYIAYSKGSESQSKSNLLVNELIAAKKRGVEVSVLIDKDKKEDKYGSRFINSETYKLLQKEQINAHFDSTNRVTHSKVVIVDLEHIFIGSHNWTNASLSDYEETSIYLRSIKLAEFYLERKKTIVSQA